MEKLGQCSRWRPNSYKDSRNSVILKKVSLYSFEKRLPGYLKEIQDTVSENAVGYLS